jgi:hypothetical protein
VAGPWGENVIGSVRRLRMPNQVLVFLRELFGYSQQATSARVNAPLAVH